MRPRLLFLCHTLPYPPDGGPWIRTYHILRLLARAFDITALCFERAGARSHFDAGEVSSNRETLSHLADVELFAIPQKHSRTSLNSWAMGKAVVSTSIGCEGLAAIDGDNILIRNDPKEFADAVLDVLEDGTLRRRLGERGRATVERGYSWEVIGQAMINTYLRLAGSHSHDLVPARSSPDYSLVR